MPNTPALIGAGISALYANNNVSDGQSALAEKIMAFVADNVAPHKRVRLLDFAEQIPKSASGKILRRVLVDAERSKHT